MFGYTFLASHLLLFLWFHNSERLELALASLEDGALERVGLVLLEHELAIPLEFRLVLDLCVQVSAAHFSAMFALVLEPRADSTEHGAERLLPRRDACFARVAQSRAA